VNAQTEYREGSFVKAHGVPTLKPILKSWIGVQRKYAMAMEQDDHAFWYRERTCIGFLSAAVWQCGGVTLEEWQTEKGPKHKSYRGRCDLYIFHRGREYFIEAKHMYSRQHPVAPTAKQRLKRELDFINRELDNAVKCAKRLQCKRTNKFGILFVAPFYPAGFRPSNFEDHISDWLIAVEKRTRPAAMAWLYEPRRHLKVRSTDDITPGVVLLARTVPA
jgi:hypothetical protein